MNNFSEFVHQVNEYKRNQQFQLALDFFKQEKGNYSAEQIGNDRFLLSAMIASLRKTNKSKYVDSFLKAYKVTINEQTDSLILTQYGWVIYDLFKAELEKNHYNKAFVLNLLRAPVGLLSAKNTDFTSSIISNIFRLMLRKEKDKQNQNDQFLNDFCDLFNPQSMSTEVPTMEQNGRIVEMASDKEMWFATKSKALFNLGLFQECFDISENALEEFQVFHYNNDLWFARRMALSKQSLGKVEEAIADLEKVFRRKKEWYIQKELAELYLQTSQIDKAFQYAIQAIRSNGFGKLEYKIGLIFLLGSILKIQANQNMANKHFWMDKLIHEQQGWRIKPELQNEINTFDPLNISYESLIAELKTFWRSQEENANEDAYIGTIKKILNDNTKGKDGFISADGQEYYFSLPSHIPFCKDIYEGSQVKFIEIAQPDGRKKAKVTKVLRG